MMTNLLHSSMKSITRKINRSYGLMTIGDFIIRHLFPQHNVIRLAAYESFLALAQVQIYFSTNMTVQFVFIIDNQKHFYD